MAVTVSDVEELSSMGWETNLDATQKQAMLGDAQREADTIYSGDVSTLPTIEGDTDVFVKNLAAHKWELASGGEASSESATGGSVQYNIGNPNETYMYLSQTRFGRTCIAHFGGRDSISIVRTW
jgi:hypothetical protein